LHEGLPTLSLTELIQLDHAPGTGARINNGIDSIGFEDHSTQREGDCDKAL
jgi:hypothetical protein